MKHTFVIAAYGESEYIEDCIKSLLWQEEESEILLASARESAFLKDLSEKYQIPLHINPDGGTIGKDWNYCLKLSETPLVTIAHQDDIYRPEYTKEILKAYEKDPGAGIYFTGYHELRDGKVEKDNLNLKIKRALLAPLSLFPGRVSERIAISTGNAICCPSVTYNKDVLEGFEFETTLRSNLDWEAWARLYESGERFSYLPRALIFHRIHSNSETNAAIKDGIRTGEDREILERFWPSPVASLINRFYSQSEKRN